MGMSASQARFLSLTARKTNVEYEGQQINQQRTALSNESSNYYSQLTSLTVPTPPSSADFTKITYSFTDGSEKNTVTSLVATKDTKDNGIYMLNYVQQVPENTMIVYGTAVVKRYGSDEDATYGISDKTLQDIEDYTYTDEDTNKTKNQNIVVYDQNEDEDGSQHQDTTTTKYYTRQQLRQRFVAAGIPESVVAGYSDTQLTEKLKLESQYKSMAVEKYGSDKWCVIYRQDSASSSYEPVLFSKADLQNADYDDKENVSLSGIKQYTYGEATTSKEVKNAAAKVEQDTSGRYISLFIYDDDTHTSGTKYDLTTKTEEDEAGYEDAMNQYYYDKAQYDQQIQEVNAKIEIIQTQDKNLELKLKQLDTEENAISTEMDAVKKVISKNVESSFKTFNA